MSLILDALNRSRRDADPLPGLDTHHPVEQVPVEGRQFVVWVVLAVALVVIAWLLMERFTTPPAADIGAPVAELSSNIDSAVASVTTELKARAAAAVPEVAEPTPQATVAIPALAAVPVVAAPAEATPAEVTPAETEPAQTSTMPAAPPESGTSLPAAEAVAVAELYQNRELQKDPVLPKPTAQVKSRRAQQSGREAMSSIGAVARSEESVDIDLILQQAREELENASLEDNGVPFLADLSQQAKDEVPTLYYQQHDYASDINQSSVMLNGTTIKVGGSPLPGMKVEEILADSVVLNFRGTQFRLRALNSWVNL